VDGFKSKTQVNVEHGSGSFQTSLAFTSTQRQYNSSTAMHVSFFCVLFVASVLARPQQVRLGPEKALDDGGFKMVLPIFDDEPFQRRREIERKQLGYLYGPSLLGNTSWFPTGSLGGAMVQEHEGLWWTDAEWLKNAVRKDAESAASALGRVS